MKYKEKDKIKIKETYLHKEIAGKGVIIDHIDDGHYGKAYFIKNVGGWYEVSEDDVKELLRDVELNVTTPTHRKETMKELNEIGG